MHTHTNDPDVPAILGSSEDYYATTLHIEVPDDSPLTVHDGYTQWPNPTTVQVGFTGEPVDYDVFLGTTVIYILESSAHPTIIQ